MYNSRKAFSLIELIFVIVLMGILGAVAVPKFASVKEDVDIDKGRADIATIRSVIFSERQQQLVKGNRDFIDKLTPSTSSTTLFTGNGSDRRLLMYGIKAGAWQHTAAKTYTYTVGTTSTTFKYYDNNGSFECTPGTGYCSSLVD
jgi:general secretion pathway protein G